MCIHVGTATSRRWSKADDDKSLVAALIYAGTATSRRWFKADDGKSLVAALIYAVTATSRRWFKAADGKSLVVALIYAGTATSRRWFKVDCKSLVVALIYAGTATSRLWFKMDGVWKVMCQLTSKFSRSPDGIPTAVLKILSYQLCTRTVLPCIIFEMFLESGKCPMLLKKTLISRQSLILYPLSVGACFMINTLSGLVLDYVVLSKYCAECQLVGDKLTGEEKTLWLEAHHTLWLQPLRVKLGHGDSWSEVVVIPFCRCHLLPLLQLHCTVVRSRCIGLPEHNCSLPWHQHTVGTMH